MRIRKLAIAALIAAVPSATAFAQSALDQSVPRVSPRDSPRTAPTDPSTTSQSGNTREIPDTRGMPERAPVTAPPATRPDVVRDPRPMNPADTRAIGAPPSTR